MEIDREVMTWNFVSDNVQLNKLREYILALGTVTSGSALVDNIIMIG